VNALKILQGSNAIDIFLSTKTEAQYTFFDIYFSNVGSVLSSDFVLIYFHHEYMYTGTSLYVSLSIKYEYSGLNGIIV
jgi:hypothetical protein